MIIELMILQLTLDGIMAHYNENVQRQQTQLLLLRLQLLPLLLLTPLHGQIKE